MYNTSRPPLQYCPPVVVTCYYIPLTGHSLCLSLEETAGSGNTKVQWRAAAVSKQKPRLLSFTHDPCLLRPTRAVGRSQGGGRMTLSCVCGPVTWCVSVSVCVYGQGWKATSVWVTTDGLVLKQPSAAATDPCWHRGLSSSSVMPHKSKKDKKVQ